MKILKFSIVAIIFVLNASTLFSQNLLIENRVWSEYIFSNQPYNSYYTIHYKVEGDTLVLGLPFKKCFYSTSEFPTPWQLHSFIRENDSGQVFKVNPSIMHIDKIYDFSLNEGDSTIINYFGPPSTVYANKVDSMLVNNEYKKRIFVSLWNQSTQYCDAWVEDIGSLCSGIGGTMTNCFVGSDDTLLCVTDNGTLTYQNQSFSSCHITNVSINKVLHESREIYLYPNPINEKSYFTSLSVTARTYNLDVYNSDGILIKSITSAKLETLFISKSEFKKGIYFYRIYNDSSIETGKFIVN